MRAEPTTRPPAVPTLEQVLFEIIAGTAPPRPAPKPKGMPS